MIAQRDGFILLRALKGVYNAAERRQKRLEIRSQRITNELHGFSSHESDRDVPRFLFPAFHKVRHGTQAWLASYCKVLPAIRAHLQVLQGFHPVSDLGIGICAK